MSPAHSAQVQCRGLPWARVHWTSGDIDPREDALPLREVHGGYAGIADIEYPGTARGLGCARRAAYLQTRRTGSRHKTDAGLGRCQRTRCTPPCTTLSWATASGTVPSSRYLNVTHPAREFAVPGFAFRDARCWDRVGIDVHLLSLIHI
eukprot:2957951-Rhodomonas_salina.2